MPPSSNGRLTLVQSQPLVAADVLAAPTVYLEPDGLALSLATLAAGTPYDLFFDTNRGQLCAALQPLWTPAGTPPPPPSGNFTLLPPATLITIGTGPGQSWNNPGAAFDGNPVKPFARSAYIGPVNAANTGLANALGQDYGAGNAVLVSQFRITAPSDDYLSNYNVDTSVTVTLDWSDDGATWVNAYTGSVNATGAVGQSYTFGGFTVPAPHRIWRADIAGDGVGRIKVAQVQFYEAATGGGPPPPPPPNVRGLVWLGGEQVNQAAVNGFYNGGQAPLLGALGIYLGSIKTDAGGPTVTAHWTSGQARVFNLYNSRNPRRHFLKVIDNSGPTPAGTWTYPISGMPTYQIRPTNNKPQNNASLVIGDPWARVRSLYGQAYYTYGSGRYWFGVQSSIVSKLNQYGTLLAGEWGLDTMDSGGIDTGRNDFAHYITEPFWGPLQLSMMEGGENAAAFYGEPNQFMAVEWEG